MPDRIALKRLTSSDLTFFENLFRKLDVGNQKSINLNANIFIKKFYPTLPDLVPTLGDVIPVSLTILGPAAAGPYVVARAITKREGYKNWRLNGEFVPDPEGQPARFDQLIKGDLAILEFTGEPGPQKVTLLLVCAQSAADVPLFTGLNALLPAGDRAMVEVSRAELAPVAASVAPTHPIWILAADPEYDAALEDAALGGTVGAAKLSKKTAKPVSAATLAAAKASAEKNGRDGEALAWIHLNKMQASGAASSIEWMSKTNAVSPFDFSATIAGKSVRIDAKSTNGEFERPVHMSLTELRTAAEGERYDLWRIYRLDEDGARLRIAEDISATAKKILAGISLPSGVAVDGVSIDPVILKWGGEVVVERPDEGADDK